MTRSSVDQKLTVEVTGAGDTAGLRLCQTPYGGGFCQPKSHDLLRQGAGSYPAGYEPGEIRVKVSGKDMEEEITLRVTADDSWEKM